MYYKYVAGIQVRIVLEDLVFMVWFQNRATYPLSCRPSGCAWEVQMSNSWFLYRVQTWHSQAILKVNHRVEGQTDSVSRIMLTAYGRWTANSHAERERKFKFKCFPIYCSFRNQTNRDRTNKTWCVPGKKTSIPWALMAGAEGAGAVGAGACSPSETYSSSSICWTAKKSLTSISTPAAPTSFWFFRLRAANCLRKGSASVK